MENVEFEEKVDLDTLVLPSKPIKFEEIGIDDIKQEAIEEREHQAASESNNNEGNKFQLKMEENILKLCEELDKERSENPTMDFSQRRLLMIKQFVEKIAQDSLERCHEIKPFSCNFCYKSFVCIHEMKEHTKVHDSKSEVEDLRNKLRSLKSEVAEVEERLKKSENKASKWAPAEKMKMKFRCEVCYFKFKQKGDLKRHVKIIHEKVRSFICKFCDLSFQTRGTLNRHVNSKHQEKKPFKCDVCDLAFSRSDHLKKHKKCKHFEKSQKKDTAKIGNVRETLDESDENKEDCGKVLEEKLKKGEREEIVSDGLTGFQERKRSFKESLEVKSSRSIKCKSNL